MNKYLKIQNSNDVSFLKSIIKVLDSQINKNGSQITDDDFKILLGITVDRIKIRPVGLAENFSVTTGTISRWRNGNNLPKPLLKKAIFRAVRDFASERLTGLAGKS